MSLCFQVFCLVEGQIGMTLYGRHHFEDMLNWENQGLTSQSICELVAVIDTAIIYPICKYTVVQCELEQGRV
jgi:hypothetical protein